MKVELPDQKGGTDKQKDGCGNGDPAEAGFCEEKIEQAECRIRTQDPKQIERTVQGFTESPGGCAKNACGGC
ncbi:MAG TPA: hypothetical protein PKY88_11685 [Anaerohalosphaeraceae bacterium]|nr:hypothetical protein [Anaerohalosphaeraceae bacterium]